MTPSKPRTCEMRAERRPDDTLLLKLSGGWTIWDGIPPVEAVEREIGAGLPRRIAFESGGVVSWDTGLVVWLEKIAAIAERHGIEVDADGLPGGARELRALALAVPERKGARREGRREPFLERAGAAGIRAAAEAGQIVTFVGEVALSFLRLLRGSAQFRGSDFRLFLQQTGAQALGIVTFISFLIGLILAFVGAVQLQQFGAQIYVANLVALGTVREMGAMMTAIIMAGRTGAAFAAQLGTMTVNEEVDALKTMGISPIDFLVLPRLLALALMMPLLVLYSDFVGILGGSVVAVTMLDISFTQYMEQTRISMGTLDIVLGLIKAAIYGVLVAVAGCMRGMQSGRSASAVGDAVTSAVVTGIVCIILASALTTVLYNILGL